MAPAGKSHIQILRRVGAKCEKALEQERPLIPLPDGRVGYGAGSQGPATVL